MKTIEQISAGTNYSAVSVGKMDQLGEHTHLLSAGVGIAGKVFVGDSLGATGAELSFQTIEPNGQIPFVHSHKNHEELYLFIKGSGEFQVDGEVFSVAEGSVVKVAPLGKRAIRNTGTDPLVMICVQYKAESFDQSDKMDGVILADALVW